jgi:DNA-binding winged helix-turn-helix (wHTH) protein
VGGGVMGAKSALSCEGPMWNRSGLFRRHLATGRLPELPASVFNDLHIHHKQRRVWCGNSEICLTRLEFDLLVFLIEDAASVKSYAQLCWEVWRMHYLGDSSSIRAAVKRLRAKLSASGTTVVVECVRGVGFRLRKATRGRDCEIERPSQQGIPSRAGFTAANDISQQYVPLL